MILLSQIISDYKDELLDQYSGRLLPSHFKAINLMQNCRTDDSLMMKARCSECQHEDYFPHSCGHRFCPHCQHYESQQWIERQRKKLLPVDYFMVTFTLPEQLRPVAWSNQSLIYDLLIKLAWQTLKTFGLNDKQLHGLIGATAVLHTNTRSLDYHPHVHFVIPAGALDKKQNLWRKNKNTYLFNQDNLAKVYYGKWITALKEEKLLVERTVPDNWVVKCTYVGKGDQAITYLGKYLYRGVLPEKNIIRNENGIVTFCYWDNKGDYHTRSLPGAKFLWLLLKHVLPRGFRRARDYGILHPNCKRLVNLLHLILKYIPPVKANTTSQRAQFHCPKCGGLMDIVDVRIPKKNMTPAVIGAS